MNVDSNDMPADIAAQIAALTDRLDAARPYNIGFPGATDFDYSALSDLFCRQLLNNVGDPWVDGAAANHTKEYEREAVAFVADLVRAPVDDRWGYVTSGGSEGNLYGLWLARGVHPGGLVYHSAAAHPSVSKAASLLAMPSVAIAADPATGLMDYDDLAAQVGIHRDLPATVVASIGTTMHEAVDDVRQITAVLDALAVHRRWIHADAALSGIPLALLDPIDRPGFDLADGADSLTVSLHKFVGSPQPAGLVVVRASDRNRVAGGQGYSGSPDATVLGSRSGHAPLMWWYAIRTHGIDGWRHRAEEACHLAAHTQQRLVDMSWPAFRHKHAFTVVLKTPPEQVLKKWVLATAGERSHIVCMPGVTGERINAFLTDLAAAIGTDVGSAPTAASGPGPDGPVLEPPDAREGLRRRVARVLR